MVYKAEISNNDTKKGHESLISYIERFFAALKETMISLCGCGFFWSRNWPLRNIYIYKQYDDY